MEATKGGQDGGALHLPAVVLQHQQDVGRYRDIHGVVGPQEDDRVVGDSGDYLEVLLGVVVAEGFQEFQDLYLVLEDGLGALLVGQDGLV